MPLLNALFHKVFDNLVAPPLLLAEKTACKITPSTVINVLPSEVDRFSDSCGRNPNHRSPNEPPPTSTFREKFDTTQDSPDPRVQKLIQKHDSYSLSDDSGYHDSGVHNVGIATLATNQGYCDGKLKPGSLSEALERAERKLKNAYERLARHSGVDQQGIVPPEVKKVMESGSFGPEVVIEAFWKNLIGILREFDRTLNGFLIFSLRNSS
jgi:hypothetical protein